MCWKLEEQLRTCIFLELLIVNEVELSFICYVSITDIVFFIYLYQRWIYPIDPKRVNEFGLTGEPVDNTDTADPNEAKPSEDGAVTTGAEVLSDKKND